VKEWLTFVTEYAVLMIEALASVVIIVATIEAFINGLRLMSPSLSRQEWRDVWLRYSHWLVAGLTFQLAADIIETSITTSWDAVGRIAAVAVIRTFLNYFLERDLTAVRQRQRATAE
jgi:uncharacterized membrane protein